MTTESYNFCEARLGDYRASSRQALAAMVEHNTRRVTTEKERQHALDQISYLGSSRALRGDDAQRLWDMVMSLNCTP